MAGRGDIEAGRAFITLYLKNNMIKPLVGAIGQARAALTQISKIAMTTGRALSKVGVTIGASYVALASGNALVVQKAGQIHKLLANAIAPAVIPILDRTLAITKVMAQWITQNQKVFTNILRIGLWMAAIGGGLKLAAQAAKGLSAALLVAQMALQAIGVMLVTTWVGPLLAGLGVLVAIGALLYRFSPTWRAFFQQNAADIQVWGKNMLATMRSIFNAASSGEFALAWRIALLGAEIEFKKFFDWITNGWLAVVTAMNKALMRMSPFGANLGFLKELEDTLKGMSADSTLGVELKSLQNELAALLR